MKTILVTRISQRGCLSQWEEEVDSLKLRASEFYGYLLDRHKQKPVIKQVGMSIFLVLPKGMPSMILEQKD